MAWTSKKWVGIGLSKISLAAVTGTVLAGLLHSSVARATVDEWVTGAAAWTWQDPATGATFYVSLSVGQDTVDVRNWGVDPVAGAFPLNLTNPGGETVTITQSGSDYEYDAEIFVTAVNEPALWCDQQRCSGKACVANPGFAHNCDEIPGQACWKWKCTPSGGGGGFDVMDVITAGPQ